MIITDNELTIKVLESVDEYYEEGKTQNICVFGAGYYRKENSLILSARIGGEIIETIEVDLRTLKVVQCHGKYNKDTEYHDRIINLVNINAKLIRKRMTANRVSTTSAPSTEQYETFYSAHRGKRISRVMYDYRDTDNELFSCVAPTLA